MTDTAIGPSMRPNATSNRIRRHDTDPGVIPAFGRLAQIVAEPPPIPNKPPRPVGDLSSASIDEIVQVVAGEFAHVERDTLAGYKHGYVGCWTCWPATRGRRGSTGGKPPGSTSPAARSWIWPRTPSGTAGCAPPLVTPSASG